MKEEIVGNINPGFIDRDVDPELLSQFLAALAQCITPEFKGPVNYSLESGNVTVEAVGPVITLQPEEKADAKKEYL